MDDIALNPVCDLVTGFCPIAKCNCRSDCMFAREIFSKRIAFECEEEDGTTTEYHPDHIWVCSLAENELFKNDEYLNTYTNYQGLLDKHKKGRESRNE